MSDTAGRPDFRLSAKTPICLDLCTLLGSMLIGFRRLSVVMRARVYFKLVVNLMPRPS